MRCDIISSCPQPGSGDDTTGKKEHVCSHVNITISENTAYGGQAEDSVDDLAIETQPHTGEIYYLVGRDAQQVPVIGSVVDPAFNKHWAARVRWSDDIDLVWEIFQDRGQLILPRPSQYTEARHRFSWHYQFGFTRKSAEEVNVTGESISDVR